MFFSVTSFIALAMTSGGGVILRTLRGDVPLVVLWVSVAGGVVYSGVGNSMALRSRLVSTCFMPSSSLSGKQGGESERANHVQKAVSKAQPFSVETSYGNCARRTVV